MTGPAEDRLAETRQNVRKFDPIRFATSRKIVFNRENIPVFPTFFAATHPLENYKGYPPPNAAGNILGRRFRRHHISRVLHVRLARE